MIDLDMINEAVKVIGAYEKDGRQFTEKEKHFVAEYAFKTGDMELVSGLVANMSIAKEDDVEFMNRYETLLGKREVWISQIENLLVALEMYRIEEEKALNKIAATLKICGVDVSVDDIREKGAGEIKQMIKKKVVI
ncbi:hypothetical protein [Anaerobium acetethylicum]|uniref:Uncharacterized protein n=1 Tax=Anaerobium acetethylicum TaxID=1619234 RepID=A0A1D3TUM6_9FIRM|nr:hypothetical protein [Anaerobium acetethylicum]SCP97750.1 hypothetical protein SAMN05421730_101354 [Anaerobium acetethylicum]